jgi:hypothetical protein
MVARMMKQTTLARLVLLVSLTISAWTISFLNSSAELQVYPLHESFVPSNVVDSLRSNNSTPDDCRQRAATPNCTQQLSTGKQVTQLYGNGPVIIGLETCDAYRKSLLLSSSTTQPRIAGLYNTGTNALAKLFEVNYPELHLTLPKSYFKYDVPWGKHVPFSRKNNVTFPHTNPTLKEQVFPVILIRDPYWWMVSMCKNPYGAKWKKSDHCPNLVVDANSNAAAPVTTKYGFKNVPLFQIHYDSVVHLWNTYYQEYLDSSTPRLLVRFEDVLFHGPAVLEEIANCVGLPVPTQFQNYLAKSKHHGSGGTDFGTAILKYSSTVGRAGQMTQDDKEFARQHLNETLLRMFHYHHPIDDENKVGL